MWIRCEPHPDWNPKSLLKAVWIQTAHGCAGYECWAFMKWNINHNLCSNESNLVIKPDQWAVAMLSWQHYQY